MNYQIQEKLQNAMLQAFYIHFRSKPFDKNIHDDSGDAYNFLISAFHDYSERMEDNGMATKDIKFEELGQILYSSFEDLKSSFEEEAKINDTAGTDNMVRGICDKLEHFCGNFRRYSKKQEEKEDGSEKEY